MLDESELFAEWVPCVGPPRVRSAVTAASSSIPLYRDTEGGEMQLGRALANPQWPCLDRPSYPKVMFSEGLIGL